jgi:hypothetical protein
MEQKAFIDIGFIWHGVSLNNAGTTDTFQAPVFTF